MAMVVMMIMRRINVALRAQVISDSVGARPNATLTVTSPQLKDNWTPAQRTMSVRTWLLLFHN